MQIVDKLLYAIGTALSENILFLNQFDFENFAFVHKYWGYEIETCY